ncbi:MAG TPA: DUF2244 domain-containing protein [Chromatiales bacterium]|nr:DUF2244 domain-containing protein [Chromatiales bacterium]
MVFYLGIVTVSLTVAGSFAWAGYWPILPFAGLELLGLGLALYASMRRGRIRESICVDERKVVVSKTSPDRRATYEFSRPWTKVELIRPPVDNWPDRLVLRSMGRSVEVGAFLTDNERKSLRKRLDSVIRQDDVARAG